jgi:hypothetical protein
MNAETDTKVVLQGIKDLIRKSSFQEGLLQCKDLLREHPDSFEGNVYVAVTEQLV